ncbi:MAG: M3 family metallopeptidase, partial [Planctomycetota bacterium]
MRNPLVRAACAALFVVLSASGTSVVFADDGFTPDANMSRSDIPELYKWDLSPVFPSDAEWEKAVWEVMTGSEKLKAFQGKLDDPVCLSKALAVYFDLHVLANKVTLYSNLLHDVDQVAPENQARLNKGLQTMDSLMSAAAFLRKEIMLMDDEAVKQAYAIVPDLVTCRSYIEGLRRRRWILLSDESERILSLAGDNLFAEIDLNEIPAAPEKAFTGILSDIPWPEITDEQGTKVRLSLSSYGRYRASSKRSVRAEAVDALFKTLKQYRHALAATLAGQVEFNSFLARSRGYSSAMEAYLDKDDLTPAVVVNLVDAINANLRPLHKYMALRKKVMNVDSLRLYDLYVPMVEGVEKEVPYKEAHEMILEALKPLGPEYMSVLKEGMDLANGWVDLFPCMNKDSGAFSASVYGCHPYVKMNYFNTLDDASTLAHEFGHALHTYFSMKNQP